MSFVRKWICAERPSRLDIGGDLSWSTQQSPLSASVPPGLAIKPNTSLSSKYMQKRSREQRSPTPRRSAPSPPDADATETQLEERVRPRPEESELAVPSSRLSSIDDGQSVQTLLMDSKCLNTPTALCSRQCITVSFPPSASET